MNRNEQWWEECLETFKAFLGMYGQLPHHSEVFRGISLGRWVRTQRYANRTGALLPGRYERLEQAWPGFFNEASPTKHNEVH
ncbi:hypothetical protein ABH924_005079 [Arthrobacter sp. GAS37]|uniref:helicase associated domain-containing protein n=1 Tax=Arthrobacter sp. GAS37 TaxID=3156261 RepID=UPI0038342D74